MYTDIHFTETLQGDRYLLQQGCNMEQHKWSVPNKSITKRHIEDNNKGSTDGICFYIIVRNNINWL